MIKNTLLIICSLTFVYTSAMAFSIDKSISQNAIIVKEAKEVKVGHQLIALVGVTGAQFRKEFKPNRLGTYFESTQSKVEVSASFFNSCATYDNMLKCGGARTTSIIKDIPSEFTNGFEGQFLDVSLGYKHACVILKMFGSSYTEVKCWGLNDKGQLEVPSSIDSPTKLVSGYHHTCVIDNKIPTCWGDNSKGQLNVPSQLTDVTDISAGNSHTCASQEEGIICWGGRFDEDASFKPKKFKLPVKALASGNSFTCGMSAVEVKCWGMTARKVSPKLPEDMGRPVSIGAYGDDICVLHSDGLDCIGIWDFQRAANQRF